VVCCKKLEVLIWKSEKVCVIFAPALQRYGDREDMMERGGFATILHDVFSF